MGFLTTFILLLFLIFAIKFENQRKVVGESLLKTFLIFWILIVFLGSFHFYGLYEISFEAYLLVIIGCFGFLIGYITYDNSTIKISGHTGHKFNVSENKEYIIFKWVFYVLLVLALVLMVKLLMLKLPVILIYGLAESRYEMNDETINFSGYMDTLVKYFAKPFLKATLIVLIVNVFHYRLQIKFIILIIILTIILLLSDGGRIFTMQIFFIFCLLLYSNRKRISKISKKRIKRTIIIFVSIPILTTIERGADIVYTIYTYYCGSLTYLTIFFNNYSEYLSDYMYGLESFQGLIKPFTGVLELLGIKEAEMVSQAYDLIAKVQTANYNITPTGKMNFYLTTFGYAYKDGGIIGVLIIHFIYGAICKYVDIKSYLKSNTVRWISIKLTFFCLILFTMMAPIFAFYRDVMVIIYIYIITTNFFSKKHYNIAKSTT